VIVGAAAEGPTGVGSGMATQDRSVATAGLGALFDAQAGAV
jgi:hypothetical protein